MHLPAYVINLERSVARREQITGSLAGAGIPFHLVTAIDGEHLDDEHADAEYDAETNRRRYLAPLSAGEIACMLSHRKAWEIFLRTSEAPAAIFLEDDIRPLADGSELQVFVEKLAALEFPALCKLNLPGRPRAANRARHARRCLIAPLTNASQALNRAAAAALLDFTATFHEPADVALQRWWDHGVRILVAEPPLFEEVRDASYASTIRPAGEAPAEGRLLRELRRPAFQARRLLRALCELLLRRRP